MQENTDESNRRIGSRLPSKDPVYFYDASGWGSLCLGWLRNISSGGFSIQTDTPQPVGTELEVELLATPENGLDKTVLSRGVVRHVAKSEGEGYALGVKTQFPIIKSTAKSIKDATPEAPLPPRRYEPGLLSPTRTAEPVASAISPMVAPPPRGNRIYRRAIAVALILIGLFLMLPRQNDATPPQVDSPKGIAYAQLKGSPTELIAQQEFYVPGRRSSSSTTDAADLELVESARLTNYSGDSFLFASWGGVNEAPDEVRETHETDGLPYAFDDSQSVPSVEQLARDLERAQRAMQQGNRTAALYLTRNAAQSLEGYPEPWQEILRDFRGSMIAHPTETPTLPILNNWIPLESELTGIPPNSPLVVYVNTDAFVMQVIKDGEVVWQFPVGLGARGSTPEGVFTIGTKIREPDWYNHGDVVPGGAPENPLGDQWLGLSDNAVPTTIGIHPTAAEESIGEALSKGCIRMQPEDARRLYSMIPVGTPVVIRSGGASPKL